MNIEKKQPKKTLLPTEITTNQATDTGMAMVLIGLLACLVSHRDIYLVAAIGLLLMNMIWPRFFVPVAKIWLGFSTLLGTFMAKVVMALIFFCVVCPVAAMRRVSGGDSDSLQLKKWKAGRGSVFTVRNHKYSTEDISKPY